MITRTEIASLPVAAEVDVLVVGGGPAGVAASLSAARLGVRTMIVEQFNCLGGIATAGGHAHICLYSEWGSPRRVVGGIPFETAQRVTSAGYGVHNNHEADFEIEGMKKVLEEMAEQAGVTLRYYTLFAETIVEDTRVVGVVVQSKSGREVILARRTVDCTGDGDVAASAGCKFLMGAEDSGPCQPATLMFTIGGVDYDRVRKFRGTDYKLKS
ncbi:MAG TPA: FAD-dependent oxidoreductase, partial [bacterium]|nr:FAD-dependent oxidoreductase [bacterium]